MSCRSGKQLLILLPSLRITGGNKEVLLLARDMQARGVNLKIVSLWRATHELSCSGLSVEYLSDFVADRSRAAFQYPILLWRFIAYILRLKGSASGCGTALLLTHFSTFLLAWLAPSLDWYCFNQDVEWMFVAAGVRRSLLRQLILATSRRARVITTNAYIDKRYEDEGILPFGQAAIWVSEFWADDSERVRETDVAMFLRHGHMKRLDLYLDMLFRLKDAGISCAVVTPDADLYEQVRGLADCLVLRPDDEGLKAIYARSKIFLLLSETEGFGLPPLEAMASGCVPFCRDSGGPRGYMQGSLAANLVPLSMPNEEILQHVIAILSNPERLSDLSREARLQFQSGFAATVATREECLRRLAASLVSDLYPSKSQTP